MQQPFPKLVCAAFSHSHTALPSVSSQRPSLQLASHFSAVVLAAANRQGGVARSSVWLSRPAGNNARVRKIAVILLRIGLRLSRGPICSGGKWITHTCTLDKRFPPLLSCSTSIKHPSPILPLYHNFNTFQSCWSRRIVIRPRWSPPKKATQIRFLV